VAGRICREIIISSFTWLQVAHAIFNKTDGEKDVQWRWVSSRNKVVAPLFCSFIVLRVSSF
jgi:hypothetical protein